jgi:predicted PolB exonuclease-like 3'-5' exonuclease
MWSKCGPSSTIILRPIDRNGRDQRPHSGRLALSRVVSISAVHRHETPDGTVALAIRSFPEVASPQEPERVIIAGFLEEAASQGAQLVGFNSQSSDMPIMIQRGIANRSRCPAFGNRPEKPWDGIG